ncbi:MAG: hypothetical protein ACRBF0_09020 [Calditrichia bacterium]
MNTTAIELGLKLFSAVPKNTSQATSFETSLKYGVIVDRHASYAQAEILNYFVKNKLSAEQLNATFHKSWQVIENSSRQELFVHQILHYLTTYGTDFTSEFVYFPAEHLSLPKATKIPLRVVRGIESAELINMALDMLSSGIALDEITLDDLLDLLDALDYKFTSVSHIKNKEASVKVISRTGIYPDSPVEFLRFLVYLSTGTTLLIKNDETIKAIKESELPIAEHVAAFGLKKCAEIFNRFKPLWLSFKTNRTNRAAINEINRLAKRHHKPMPVDVLNSVTSISYSTTEVLEALQQVNNFRKIRLLNALNIRLNAADTFLYRIRNGKSFSKEKHTNKSALYYRTMFNLVYENLLDSLDLAGKKVAYPENIDYALPVSEKMFVGNFPVGTKITSENLASGIYWENKWGANDLDLSALQLSGKVGWNSVFKSKGLLYSGDITDAPNGATELLYTKKNLPNPALSIANIYSGTLGCKFKIIIGSAPRVRENYMFDPNELILEAESTMKGSQQILGLFLPEEGNTVSFVIINTVFGSMSVSSNSIHNQNARKALYFQYASPISMRKLLTDAGAILVSDEKSEINLMPHHLSKSTIVTIFS